MSAKNASSIQVCIKVRPCEPELTSLWQVKEGCSIHLADSHAEPCVFDYVFGEGASNQEVFDRMAKHIVHACMQGFNGTIFAYGQTSSGKTYTMMGDGQNPGVMVLAAKEIFQQISTETDRDFLLRVGYIEIYNEKIYDLLNKKNQDLKIHESGNGMVNVNCEECIITSEDDLLRLLCMGNKERTVGETNMNERSSRSHAIFRIIIESRKSDRSADDAVIQSVLNLVDLAGSERADQTGARGARLKEGGHINKSLLFLSNVIKSLSENVDNKFISFRDSKLTRILQASLGGNAFTSIICTIKPSIMEESQSTLSFATRAKKIRIKPQVNEMVSDATMMKRLEREIKELKDKLAEEERKNESQLKVQDLERRIKSDMHKIISSTSLGDKCRQKRRRTWCPTASGQELDPPESGTANDCLVQFSKMSALPKPTFFPHSNFGRRLGNIPQTINILGSLNISTDGNVDDEQFLPAECVDFGSPGMDVQMARLTSRQLPDLALTPITSQMGPVICESLQAEVTNLTAANQAANSKIHDLEEQLSALKETMTALEVANRDAVSLEFEFEAHKKSSKLRVNELLSVLSEKDLAIEKLRNSLDECNREVLRNSKEARMRSICQAPEESVDGTCNKCEQLESCECDHLRAEIAATRAKLDSVQSALSQASSEVYVKTTDCERLSKQISTAQDDFELLQTKYNTLEQQWQGQQLAIEALQSNHDTIQANYQKLQEEYEHLGRTSKASEADNSKLQTEIETLKEQVMEAQSMLKDAQVSASLAEEFKAKNQELKAKITDLESNLSEIQSEYDCLSNQLMESVQENDALREELKQRPSSFEVDSMKSSGVGTECSEPEHELDLESDLLQQFVQLSESIHQIELQHHSGCSRLFRAINLDRDLEEPGLKLCLESADCIESDSRQLDASDSISLKGSFKRHRFQIRRLTQEQVILEEERRLLDIISQLEQEVAEKSALMEATEATINEMREQMSSLESALLEKSVIVNKVEDYQRQIESLEKQNAEMTMVYEELQDKVIRESSMSENLLVIPPDDDTLPGVHPSTPGMKDQEPQEVATLKASLAELRTRVCAMQEEIDSQLRQMQLKDENIAKLYTEIEEMSERCLSMEVRMAELEEDAKQKQELLDCQAQKLSDGVRLIDQLQEKNAQLVQQTTKVEAPSEYVNQIEELRESLRTANEELRDTKRVKEDEINALQLKYMMKMEASESENCAKLRLCSQELEECKDRYESSVAALKDQLTQAGEELASVTARCQTELEGIRGTLQEKINHAEEERNKLNAQHQAELDGLREALEKKIAEAEAQQLSIETTLKEQLSQAQEEREKATSKLEEMKITLEEMIGHRNTMRETIAELEKSKSDHELALDKVKAERMQFENLYEKSQEQLQIQLSNMEQNNLDTQAHSEQLEKITELQAQCEQQVQDMEKLSQEKMTLQLEIQEANEHLSNSLKKCEELELQMNALKTQNVMEKSDLEAKLETFTAKMSDLEEALQKAQLKTLEHDDLISQHERLKICLSEANEVSCNLEKKIECLNSELLTSQEGISNRDDEIKQLRLELKHALDAKDTTRSEQLELVAQLKAVEDKMSTQAGNFQRELTDLKGSMDELQLKLKSLQETKDNLEAGNEELKLKLRNAQDLQNALEEEQKLCTSLRANIANLEQSKTRLEEQMRVEVDQRFMEMSRNFELSQNTIGELTTKCENLRSQLETETNNFQRKKESLDLIISDLEKEKQELEEKLSILKEKDETIDRLKAQLTSNEATLSSLQEAMEAANNKSLEMGQKVDELSRECEMLRSELQSKEACFQKEKHMSDGTISSLLEDKRGLEKKLCTFNDILSKHEEFTKECENLRSTLKSKDASFRMEKERMDGTISSLLEDKRNLEEKLCTVNDIVTKLQGELTALQAIKGNGSNASFESNASNGSPVNAPARKSLDRNPGASGPRKSLTSETEVRRNRRISVHDERRQSYWNDFRECGTMTDPVDNNCNCAELNARLQECQRDFFICESKVTALNMELKHHPLKDENAQLKRRVLEEQEKARAEQKRFKAKLHDLNARINDLTDAAASSAMPIADQQEQAKNSVRPEMVTRDTQTESELEAILEKTNTKYQDAVQLLRFRYNLIKELEGKVRQNENNDTSNITSLTAGQNSALKAQCEAQKRELAVIRNKYESAKRVLGMRKDEMDKIRAKLAQYEAGESTK
ncbi:kinesin-like protein KIN-7O isoform X2 [Drosophila elegans]|uniref:kinesin-like protein KIN-7O isoform X2 n=1 Tax=Drosophila elegans TaxID=30023 RepID=UPI0007E6F1CE|nr:kinesin-like protein KIN-7O isoform X2 [Drosophila elegans]